MPAVCRFEPDFLRMIVALVGAALYPPDLGSARFIAWSIRHRLIDLLPARYPKAVMMASKAEIRQTFRDRVWSIPASEQAAASQAICDTLLARWRRQPPRAVAAFYPIKGEPAIGPLLEWARRRERLHLPRIVERTLIFHQIEEWVELIEGPHGTREPNPTLLRMNPDFFDLILVPGVAFTSEGQRLGRGGGYYDRFLSTLPPRVRRVGVAFPVQLADSLPVEPHDQAVDEVVVGT